MNAVEREVLRYLHATEATDALREQISRASDAAEKVISVRSVFARFSCVAEENGVTVGGCFFPGASLVKNLRGCDETFLIALTLGSECDRLLRIETVKGASFAAILQAVLTERIERELDALEASVGKTLSENERLRPRFSLGYGDTVLSSQRDFFRVLPVTKQTGIVLTEQCLMIPSKSVTAFLGIQNQG